MEEVSFGQSKSPRCDECKRLFASNKYPEPWATVDGRLLCYGCHLKSEGRVAPEVATARPHSAPKAPPVWFMVGGRLEWQLPEDDPLRQFAIDATQIALEAIDVLVARQRDYGPANISQGGDGGLMVRLRDKFERAWHLHVTGAEPTSESVDDTDIDLSNYALIRRMGRQGRWPVPFEPIVLRRMEDGN